MDIALGTFLDELKEQGLLINGDLERVIRSQTHPAWNLTESKQEILRNAMREMNAREIGVFTAAAIVIGFINSK